MASSPWILLVVCTTAMFFSASASRDRYNDANLFDITHQYLNESTVFGSPDGLNASVKILKHDYIDQGTTFNTANIELLTTNAGTHVRAFTCVGDLDLSALNGPALVVEFPRDKNITAEALQSLNLPEGVTRLLFKTLNTDRQLMKKKEFDSSYTGFLLDGAEWLATHTNVKLVGIDYLAAGVISDRDAVYQAFGKKIIPVEGLKLDDIIPGEYSLHCLPISIPDAIGSPTRCVLFQ